MQGVEKSPQAEVEMGPFLLSLFTMDKCLERMEKGAQISEGMGEQRGGRQRGNEDKGKQHKQKPTREIKFRIINVSERQSYTRKRRRKNSRKQQNYYTGEK